MRLSFSTVSICLLALICLCLAACDDLDPQPTPTPKLTGPTIAPSPTFFPRESTEIFYEGQNNSTAAALPPDSALPPLAVGTSVPGSSYQTVSVTAQDGALLIGDFYQRGTERVPGVLMLAPDRAAWGNFPAKINAAGFTVLVMNLRDTAPLLDFTVMLQALSSGEADPAHLAVIGAGTGADVALLGCAGDLLCDAVALLSPSGDQSLVDAMAAFNPRPIFLTASENDPVSFAMIQRLQTAATGEILFQPFTSAGHATDLLVNRPDLGDLIIEWLTLQLG